MDDGTEVRDDRGRQGDDAIFAPTSVRPRGRRPYLAIALALGIVTLVGLGALDAWPGGAPPTASERAAAVVPSFAHASPEREGVAPRRSPAPIPTAPAGAFELDLRPAGSHLVVHGDVFSPRVMQVIVAIDDGQGHIGMVKFARLVDGNPSTGLGAGARFDVHFNVPDELMGEGLWIEATAFSAAGEQLETIRRLITRETNVVIGFLPRIMRPGPVGADTGHS